MRLLWLEMACILAGSVLAIAQAQGPVSGPSGNASYTQVDSPQNGQPEPEANLPDAPSATDSRTGNPHNDDPRIDDPHKENKLSNLPAALLHDQAGIWTSPARIRLTDATWMVPLGGFAAALLATDSDVSRHLSNDPSTLLRYKHISDYGAYSMGGGAAGLYLLGVATHNDHQRESGLLSGEAALNALAIVEGIKFASGRERPYLDNANGRFRAGWGIISLGAFRGSVGHRRDHGA